MVLERVVIILDTVVNFIKDIGDFFKNIFVSFYNLLNRYIPKEGLLVIGIVLGAFIICMIFKKITER